MTGVSSLLRVAVDLVRLTIVQPIRDGLVRPHGWPAGLGAITAGSAAVYATVALAVVFAPVVRATGDLSVAFSRVTLPAAVVPVLVAATLLSLSLVQTAALHASWPLRVVAVLLSAVSISWFAIPAFLHPLGLVGPITAVLGLVAVTLLRRRAAFAWGEFVTVTVLICLGTLVPIALQAASNPFGVDWRARMLEGALGNLSVLAYPAVLMAGAALAQIAVTAAEAAAGAAGRELPSVWFRGFLGALIGWRLIDVTTAAAAGAVTLPTVVTGLAVLAAVGALALALGVGRRPPAVAEYTVDTSRLGYPLAIAMTWLVLLSLPASLIREVAHVLRGGLVVGISDVLLDGLRSPITPLAVRALVGLVALAFAVRLAGRGRVVEAVFLAGFCVVAVGQAMAYLPGLGFLQSDWAPAVAMVATGVALVALPWLAAQGLLSRERTTAVASVLLLCAVYPHRAVLDDPISALLGFSGVGAVLFGLVWRVLTEGDVTREGSPGLPVPARVLGFAANALFAVTAMAFVAVSRASGSTLDLTRFADLGDATLGTPLFVAAVVGGLAVALRRPRAGAAGTTVDQGVA